MSPEEENDELKKARFYYETVVKADEISKRSYERVNSKISLLITILSAVIPILTGLGYLVLSSVIAVPFFIFYVISLVFFVLALVNCVILLSPRQFICVDFGEHIVKYEKESLEFNIFKISHSWEDAVKENINRILSLQSRLQRTVQLITIGLVALVFSFILLGLNYYLFDTIDSAFYESMISESGLQLILLIVCLCIFVIVALLIVNCTSIKDEKEPETQTKRGEVSDNNGGFEMANRSLDRLNLFEAVVFGLYGNWLISLLVDKISFQNYPPYDLNVFGIWYQEVCVGLAFFCLILLFVFSIFRPDLINRKFLFILYAGHTLSLWAAFTVEGMTKSNTIFLLIGLILFYITFIIEIRRIKISTQQKVNSPAP